MRPQADLAFAFTPESLELQACTDVSKLCFHSSQRCKDKWEGCVLDLRPSELVLGQIHTQITFSTQTSMLSVRQFESHKP